VKLKLTYSLCLVALTVAMGSLGEVPKPVETEMEAPPAREEASDNVLPLIHFTKGDTTKTLESLGFKGGNLDDGKHDFFLMTEKGTTYLRSTYILEPKTEAKYLYKEQEWDTRVYPFLRWRWRARQIPPKGKVTDSKVSDAAAQIYIMWRAFPRYYIIKYFWGSNDKVGDVLTQGNVFTGSLWGLVIRTGGPTGVWRTETQNIYEDFKKAFRREPPGNARGLAVLSDGDDSEGESSADYADFDALKVNRSTAKPTSKQ
jgi:hypothetical protein